MIASMQGGWWWTCCCRAHQSAVLQAPARAQTTKPPNKQKNTSILKFPSLSFLTLPPDLVSKKLGQIISVITKGGVCHGVALSYLHEKVFEGKKKKKNYGNIQILFTMPKCNLQKKSSQRENPKSFEIIIITLL